MENTLMKDVYYPQHLPYSYNYWGIAESLSKFMAKGLGIWSPFDPSPPQMKIIAPLFYSL